MEPIGSGLGDRVHDRTGELSVFRTEAVGQEPEFGDGVGVRNQPRAHVLGLIDLGAIYQRKHWPTPADHRWKRFPTNRRDRKPDCDRSIRRWCWWENADCNETGRDTSGH